MTDPHTAYERARQRQILRFGRAARCRRCGCAEPVALICPALCYECDLFLRTGKRYELHHLAGQDTGPSIYLPGNRHRVLSLFQYDWPKEVQAMPPNFVRFAYGLIDLDDIGLFARNYDLSWRRFVVGTIDSETFDGTYEFSLERRNA